MAGHLGKRISGPAPLLGRLRRLCAYPRWCWVRELNPQPISYEEIALPLS